MKNRSIIWVLFFLFFFCNQVKSQKYVNMAGHSTKVFLKGIHDSRINTFEQNTKAFLDLINIAYRNNTMPKIPSSIARENVNKLISNHWVISSFFSVRTDVIENILDIGDGKYEIRNLQIVLEEADDDYKQQDAVIVFDTKGNIVDFKIAIAYHSISSILRDTMTVTELRQRQLIINFVEDFRTSYNLKDTSFLNKVFSDKALIITGKVIKKYKEGRISNVYEFKKQTKAQYLSNLKSIFANSKLLNINFDSISVVKDPRKENIYGVNLFQTWNSESIKGGKYRDVGYVFLLIDFADEANPVIWVRTWANENYFSLNSIAPE